MTGHAASDAVVGASPPNAPVAGSATTDWKRTPQRRRADQSIWRRLGEPLLVLALVLAAWQAFSKSGAIDSRDLPGIDVIFGELRNDLSDTVLWTSTWSSLRLWLIGMAVVVGATIPLGLLIGVSWPLFEATRLSVEFLRTIPSIAALPILIFMYGVSDRLVITLIVLTAAWPLLIQAMTGAHDVDPTSVETAQVYGLRRHQIFVQVVLPSALPYVMTGVKLAANIGLIIAIAASLVVGGEGLGALIGSASDAGNTASVYGRVLFTGLLGLAVSIAVSRLERRVLRWHSSQRLPQ